MICYQYLPYTLTLNSPVILTTLGGDPNSSQTLPYIPGSAIRGALAKALGDPGTDTAKQREFHHLVLGGNVRYLHAYPAHDSRRALPVPVSVQRKKYEVENDRTISAFDLAAYDGHPSLDQDLSESWPEDQLTAPAEGFLTIGAARPTLVQPELSARIHHQRDRKKGRAWKDKQGETHGAIFAFESLDAGQSLKGIIQVRGDSEEECLRIEDRIKGLLGDSILVGRSRRAGYGGMARVQWETGRKREVEGVGTEGFRPVTGDIKTGTEFRLLLTSGCIAHDPVTGQMDPGGLESLIGQALGDRATLVRKRWAFETIGGFNRKWCLETPQVLAVAGGSVLVLRTNQDIPADDLRCIEDEGLGERKEEGYGRLLFLDAPMKSVSLHRPDEPSPSREVEGNPPQLVSTIENRILDAQINKKIEQTAARFAQSASAIRLPTNSLIGRLRTPLRGDPQAAIATLKDWLKGDNGKNRLKRPAMDQLDRCRIGMDGDKSSLARWLEYATDKDKLSNWLQVATIAQQCHIVSEQSARQFLEGKSEELSVRLIDAVLAAMAIRNKT